MLIDICVCTFRRASLEATLMSLGNQIPPPEATLRIIVADNDEVPSARSLVERVSQTLPLSVIYVHAPSRNISIARNACLDTAEGDWVAFIDDDEIAPPDWLRSLASKLDTGHHDAVFGPAMAKYPEGTPEWIRRADYHSNIPEARNGSVQTGHTCNAMIRRAAPSFAGQRFLLEKGRTGGEDTEFFFRAWRAGADMAIAETAHVYEPVEPGRLTFSWVAKRKLRSGITYGRLARVNLSFVATAASLIATSLKIVFCAAMSAVTFASETRRNFWALRVIFHAGAFASIFSLKEQELYG
jgi:succinoglycan biosynthesis protein ExoM